MGCVLATLGILGTVVITGLCLWKLDDPLGVRLKIAGALDLVWLFIVLTSGHGGGGDDNDSRGGLSWNDWYTRNRSRGIPGFGPENRR